MRGSGPHPAMVNRSWLAASRTQFCLFFFVVKSDKICILTAKQKKKNKCRKCRQIFLKILHIRYKKVNAKKGGKRMREKRRKMREMRSGLIFLACTVISGATAMFGVNVLPVMAAESVGEEMVVSDDVDVDAANELSENSRGG